MGVNGTLSSTGFGVYHNAADFSIGRNNKFGRGNCGNCRALVHAGGNKLNINYGNDFKGGTTVTGKFCIGNTCIDENDLKKIKSSSVHSVVGWAIHPTFPIFNTYGKPYTLGTSGGKHGFNHHLHSWEGGDQWDQVYMYRGWRIEAWHHGDTHPRHKVLDFTSRSSNKGSWSHVFHQNTITTYRTTWVGY